MLAALRSCFGVAFIMVAGVWLGGEPISSPEKCLKNAKTENVAVGSEA
jgi:hypothetical protein